jgi:hypothetical protein
MIYVARSAELADWASDVGLSKHIYKIGVAGDPVEPLIAAGWAGFGKWVLVAQREVDPCPDEEAIFTRLAPKVKMIDPTLYPRIRGTRGLFKIVPVKVENHIVVSRALAGEEDSTALKLKPADFAAYLIHNALRGEATS